MERPTLWQRLARARVVQVVVVYLGAAWGIIEVTGALTEALSLPDWVPPVTILLLVIGLLIIGATAWVQSMPSTTAAEAAGEVPGDWEVAPGEIVASLRAGRLPHLTWGRVVAGGVVALALMFAGAGLHNLLAGDGDTPLTGAGAEAAAGIAILPFNVSGSEHELYRDGLVDLLSANLDGVGGLRTIDSRTVLSQWDRTVGAGSRPDLAVALDAAERTGARYAVVGSLVPAGSSIRLDTEIYELPGGEQLGSARAEGPVDGMLALVDALSVEITGELLAGSGETASERRIASLTTSSLPALEAYLEGERLYRGGDFIGAGERFERAVAIDSMFALGWARLGAAKGWGLGEVFQRSREARAVAYQLIDRLGPREASMIRARMAWIRGEPDGIPILEEFVRRYPDESEAWYDLADLYFHQADFVAKTAGEIARTFEQAIELDPSFAGYYIHAIDLAFRAADSAKTRNLIDAYWRAGGEENQFSVHWDPGFDVYFGDEPTRAAAIDSALAIPGKAVIFGNRTSYSDRPAREVGFLRAALDDPREVDNVFPRYSRALRRAGRWREARPALEARPENASAILGRVRWQMLYGLGPIDRLHDDLAAIECGDRSFCWREVAFHATHAGHAEEAGRAMAELDRLLREAGAEHGADSRQARIVDFDLARARGWAALAADEPERAVALWQEREGTVEVDFLNYAMALEATGDLEAAGDYYATQTWRGNGSFARYRLARVYEELDRRDEALQHYLRVLAAWEDADPDFEPMLDARQAVARLGGVEAS